MGPEKGEGSPCFGGGNLEVGTGYQCLEHIKTLVNTKGLNKGLFKELSKLYLSGSRSSRSRLISSFAKPKVDRRYFFPLKTTPCNLPLRT